MDGDTSGRERSGLGQPGLLEGRPVVPSSSDSSEGPLPSPPLGMAIFSLRALC